MDHSPRPRKSSAGTRSSRRSRRTRPFRNKGKLKGFVWVWMERLTPKKPRVPQPSVVAVRVASLADKDVLLALDPAKFFTEPHYNGFPAVLVRFPAVSARELRA